MRGQQLYQLRETGGVVADPGPGHHQGIGVDDGDIVVTLGPVDATRACHCSSSTLGLECEPRTCGGTLMEALRARHLTSRLQIQRLAEATVYLEVCSDR